MSSALIVPVMKNFKGFTQLMHSVDIPVLPIVYDNWTENHGVSVAWNRGIQRAIDAGADYIFIANDDTTFEPGTMTKMIRSLNMGYNLVTPLNNRDEAPSRDTGYTEHPDFASFAITQETVARFGLFDEQIHSYFNDNDYAYRVKIGGGKAVCRTDAGFHHVGSVTQFYDQNDWVVPGWMFDQARLYYVAKWGGMPGEEKFTSPFDS